VRWPPAPRLLVLNYPNTLMASILISVIPSLLQTFVASVVGYGLARYRFWGKPVVFFLILATFIIPPQNIVIPHMLTVIFLEGGVTTVPMQLSRFAQAYENLYPPGTVIIFDRINEAVKMSRTFLNILPLLVMYFILQRWFVESVEMTGITGE
jgi:ABC-type glycerol-3-phosphate transport system permease component